jgi:hypothetical protein
MEGCPKSVVQIVCDSCRLSGTQQLPLWHAGLRHPTQRKASNGLTPHQLRMLRCLQCLHRRTVFSVIVYQKLGKCPMGASSESAFVVITVFNPMHYGIYFYFSHTRHTHTHTRAFVHTCNYMADCAYGMLASAKDRPKPTNFHCLCRP